jgi:hypothetical protein
LLVDCLIRDRGTRDVTPVPRGSGP